MGIPVPQASDSPVGSGAGKEGYPLGVCCPSGHRSRPLLLPHASWETASTWVARGAFGAELSSWPPEAALAGATQAPSLYSWPQRKWRKQAVAKGRALVKGARTKPSLSLIKECLISPPTNAGHPQKGTGAPVARRT